ncbi:hypothetical protein CONLIGDRAFT_692467 [Coniochaeta ligniaria NRRL 30616]|uniref:Uncharacterized protein n=1 Tax=Coniochaeta ligniaria NRRL 30616 TaxID=1408157 RepID=A0A1J7J542_9PEZI|nr:hypothetical protein CONLIGDRAFT_692467 [Coniochaeta ligniaria NRRL 30616]
MVHFILTSTKRNEQQILEFSTTEPPRRCHIFTLIVWLPGAAARPLTTSADAIEWEKKANDRHIYNVKNHDQLYAEAITEIWNRQRQSFGNTQEHDDEDVQSQGDKDDRCNISPCVPGFLGDIVKFLLDRDTWEPSGSSRLDADVLPGTSSPIQKPQSPNPRALSACSKLQQQPSDLNA